MKFLTIIFIAAFVSGCSSTMTKEQKADVYDDKYQNTVMHTPSLDRSSNVYQKAKATFCDGGKVTTFNAGRNYGYIVCKDGGYFTFDTEKVRFKEANKI